MTDLGQIHASLEAINDGINCEIVNFQNWLDEQRENKVSDKDILEDINNYWEMNPFETLEDAEEYFNSLGV